MNLHAYESRGRNPVPLLLTLLVCGHAMSCSSSRSQPPGLESASRDIAAALHSGDRKKALSNAEEVLKELPDDPRAWQLAADTLLRTGQVERAAKLYDRFAEARPATVPHLWQRGIALTLAGEYQKAADQFESHRGVNPHDVENAAWHFLCLAKLTTAEQAREKLLPAPGDPRPPLKEILQMLKDGKAKPVIDRIEQFSPGTPERRSAAFYGYLYLGMAADAEGDSAQAFRWVERSTQYAENNYMGDVARVYAEILKQDSEQ